MCGILGVVGKDAQELSESVLTSALGTLAHRGPDGQGAKRFPGCILGQTRLAIIDLVTGDQPMEDQETGRWVAFNGEIYNYKELRMKLEAVGHTFRTKSDTEVILKAYDAYGADCPKHLDGMFALAIWDPKQRTLFLARDRFGKKPLYYTKLTSGAYAFASEIKALRALGARQALDFAAVDNYLDRMYVPSWKSVYKDIGQVPPAHGGLLRDGSLSLFRYWTIPHAPLLISYDEAKEEVRRLLSEAVKKRMLAADVEVGSLLSGGVDSTFVSLLAAEHLDHPLKTFSLGYGEYADELPYAKQAAESIGSEHFTLTAGSRDVAALERVIAYFDEPHADTSDFPQHLVSELAASKVKVALSGDGADELFMGYGWYSRHMNLSYKAHTFEKLFLDPFQGYRRATAIFPQRERRALWKDARAVNDDIYASGAYPPGLTPFERINWFDLTTYLPGQLLSKVDRTGMLHSLEVRSPFLDTALAEFAVNLPRAYKMDGKEYKIVLKDLLAERMPRDFVYRRKQGFGAPVKQWLREPEMEAYLRGKLGAQAKTRDFLRGDRIDALVSAFYAGSDRPFMQLWTLLCLELWLESTHPTY